MKPIEKLRETSIKNNYRKVPMRNSIKLAIFLRFPWDLWTLWWSLSWYLIKLLLWFSHSSRLNESKNDTQPNCRNVPFPSSCFNLDDYTINSSYTAFRYKFVRVTEIGCICRTLRKCTVNARYGVIPFSSKEFWFLLFELSSVRPSVRPSVSNAWAQNWLISFFMIFFHKVR